jgi:hypothetical protein
MQDPPDGFGAVDPEIGLVVIIPPERDDKT